MTSTSAVGGRFGLFKDRKLVDVPHETTRLLLDSARIAHETEEIGK